MSRKNPTPHKCAVCEAPILRKGEHHRYCKGCVSLITGGVSSAKPQLVESCMVCGKRVRLSRKEIREKEAKNEPLPKRRASLCSKRCYDEHRKRVTYLKVCQFCLSPFLVNIYHDTLSGLVSNYCQECRSSRNAYMEHFHMTKKKKKALQQAKEEVEMYIVSKQMEEVKAFIDEILRPPKPNRRSKRTNSKESKD